LLRSWFGRGGDCRRQVCGGDGTHGGKGFADHMLVTQRADLQQGQQIAHVHRKQVLAVEAVLYNA